MRSLPTTHSLRTPGPLQRGIVWCMIGLQVLSGIPLHAWVGAAPPVLIRSADPGLQDPPLVRTPAGMQIQRSLPPHSPATRIEPLSTNATDADVLRSRLFSFPLRPVEAPEGGGLLVGLRRVFGAAPSRESPEANGSLEALLAELSRSANPRETSALEQYHTAHPDSRWSPALRHELACRQFSQGYFRRAMDQWESIWKNSHDASDAGSVAVCDEVLSCLIEAALGLSDARRLSRLIGEAEKRPGNNVLDGKIERARQAVWLLRHKGGQNVMCGPLALYAILQHQQQPFDPIRLDAVTDDYIATGLPLTELRKQAGHYGLDLEMARRTTATDIPVPSVMHSGGGHYSSIVERDGDQYFLVDRAMQFQGWVPREAIDEQSSGYYLVPKSALGAGFEAVPEAEAATVYGRDGLHGQEPNGPNSTPCAQTAGGTCGSCRGMPQYSFNAKLAAVRIQDNPVGYAPPVGPAVNLMLTYADLDDSKPATSPTFSNAGRVWAIDWVAWIDPVAGKLTASSRVTVHVPGGGTEISRYVPATDVFGPNDRSQAVVRRDSGTRYVRSLADGSSEVYETPDNPGAPNRIFLTRVVDPSGNALTMTYDATLRLVGLTDAIGQVTTLEYGVATDPWKVTRVTDPFGRAATLAYDAAGRLESITDTLGLRSSFAYDAAEFITSMTTPYGTTTFAKVQGSPAYNRTVTATDPMGGQERIQFIEPVSLPTTAPSVPSSVTVRGKTVSFRAETARLGFRNSFYWSKQAMQQSPGDVASARNYRWFTDASYLVTGVLESVREPLEDPVWFNYPGQASGNQPYYAGVTASPDKVLRVLPDGTPQLLQLGANPLGRLTNVIDALGRNTVLRYATNQVDLLEVLQRTGSNSLDRLLLLTWDANHRPLTLTDASGNTTTYTYNPRGQLLTSSNPKGEVRTFIYDSNGYLTAIDGPLPGAADRMVFTYDAVGRVRTVTDMDGATLTYDYDAMDRTTVVTHSDGTFEQFTYERLDRVRARDRLGRIHRFAYDDLQRMVEVVDPLGQATRFEWCPCGVLAGITDPMGRQTRWRYDLQGRTIAKEYADGAGTAISYETGTSRVRQVVDEKGQFTVFDYNTDDSIARVSHPNAIIPTPSVEFQYDVDFPRVTRMTDGSGVTTYAYNPASIPPVLGAGQLASIDGPLPNDTQTFAYSVLGETIQRSIGASVTSAEFDAIGRTRSITHALGTFEFQYQGPTDRLVRMAYPNGVVSTYAYHGVETDGRLRELRHDRGATLISKYLLEHNAVGEVTAWSVEQGGGASVDAFTHDAAGQLIRSVRTRTGSPSQTTEMSYDPAGNRTSEVIGTVRRDFEYNALNEIASGSARVAAETAYEWDGAQRLTAVVRGDRRSEFQYDGLGRRIRIIEKQGNTVLLDRRYVWSGGNVAEERDATGATVLRRFFGQGEQVLQGPAAGTYYYTWDHLGSIREMTDSTGTVRARYEYDLWGQRTRVEGDLDAAFGFTGFFFHEPSGLCLAAFRAYDPSLGRWLSRDPFEEAAGLNLYEYAGNDPVLNVDPDGAFPWVTGLIGAGIGAAVNGYVTWSSGGNWRAIGYSALRGGVAGGVAGLTLGFGGPALAGVFGGGITGGAFAGGVGAAAGNLAAQGLDAATGRRCSFDWNEFLTSVGFGALFGGAFLRPYTSSASQQVSSWASRGITPDLNPGRWVMTGFPNLGNYLRTVGPVLRGTPFSNSVTRALNGSNLSYPGGATGNLAGLLGQRVVIP